MPNPYHDSEGKFTSREGMIAAIDQLAVTGKVKEYLELRAQFDQIDATQTVILSTEEFERLTQTSNKPNINLEDAGTYALSIMVTDLVYEQPNKAEGVTEPIDVNKVKEIVEASKYDPEVLFEAIRGTSHLPMDDKMELLQKSGWLEGYIHLYEFPPNFEENEGELVAYKQQITEDAKKMVDSPIDGFAKNRMADLIAANFKEPEDLDLAIAVTDFNHEFGNPGAKIVSNPHVSKTQVLTILDKVVESGSIQTYWQVRSNLKGTLKNRDVTLLPPILEDEIEPLKQPVAPELEKQIETTAPKPAPNGGVTPQTWEEQKRHERNLLKADIHEERFNELKKLAKRNNLQFGESRIIKDRLQNAITYLNILQDHQGIKDTL
jgi:PHD/YefM family antitoxin component YafN of YafNO toxin-antitoxin module